MSNEQCRISSAKGNAKKLAKKNQISHMISWILIMIIIIKKEKQESSDVNDLCPYVSDQLEKGGKVLGSLSHIGLIIGSCHPSTSVFLCRSANRNNLLGLCFFH